MTEKELNDYLYHHNRTLWMAINHHRTHKNKPIAFQGYPYLKAIYLDESPNITIIKSTQSGLSEYLTCLDMAKASKGRSVFHVLPTGNLRNRYVRNRVDKSIQNTKYYYQLVQESEEKKEYGRGSESVSLKHIGDGTIAYVSSNSEASFTEFPADDTVIDELDQCDQNILPMADERLSNSDDPRRVRISNPTIEGYGIDFLYEKSDQKKWFTKCPHCGNWFIPDWFDHVVAQVSEGEYEIRDPGFNFEEGQEINMICDKCGGAVPKGEPGSWVKTYSNRKSHSGYQISKLFTAKTTIREMADRFSDGLVNPVILQRFYNADLGLAFTADGSKITREDLRAATGAHSMKGRIKGYPVMGVDVGALCNYVIGYIQPDGSVLVGEIGVLPTTANAVSQKAVEKKIKIIVIDARPEGFLVRRLKEIFPRTISCFYAEESAKEMVDRNRNVRVDRTSSLDAVKEGLATGRYILPVDWQAVGDFLPQMTAATRIFDPEAHRGQGAYKWTEGSKADHYHHAFNYMSIAQRVLRVLSR